MKVVINKCFGGFGLSTEAMKRAIAEGAVGVRAMTESEYGTRPDSKEEFRDAGDGYRVGWIGSVLFKDGRVWTYDDRQKHRSDPVLVRIVEEMGGEANGDCADLRIIEIPDGVEFEIDDYDGKESIHEVHRSWG